MPGTSGQKDPRSYVIIKPLPVPNQKGVKVQARSDTVYSSWGVTREQVFRANYQRRQRQLTVGFRSPSYKPYQELGQPLYLEAKKLILHSLGQAGEDTKDEDLDFADDVAGAAKTHPALKDSQDKTKPLLTPSVIQNRREKDLRSLSKGLSHTRQLVSASRHGRGYFCQLKKEKEEKADANKADLKRPMGACSIGSQSSRYSSSAEDDYTDNDDEEEEMEEQQWAAQRQPCNRFFQTEMKECRKKKKEPGRRSRPFTPVHNSLFSENLFDADPEPLFRQLCALHWLLEALYIEPLSAMRPVSSCWNIKEPGGTKNTLKRISKEKEVEAKWDHFTTQAKAKKPIPRVLKSQFQRPRRFSFMSSSRYSALSSSVTPTMGSTSSLIPSSEEVVPAASVSSDMPREAEDNESITNNSVIQAKQAKEEDESPMSEYLQSLVEEIRLSVLKQLNEEENQKKLKLVRTPSMSMIEEKTNIPECVEQEKARTPKQRPKSSPAVRISPTTKFITEKSSMTSEMRKKFFEVADEAALVLHNNMEAIERRREEFSNQKFHALDNITFFHQDMEKLRKPFHHVREDKDYANTENWFFSLLARIPESLKKNLKIQKILSKLEKLEEKQYIKIRPNSFLKVLNGLRPWELCSPDISVAIEFVRESLVQMSPEDYATWLQTRVSANCQRAQSAPPMR
ncbi:coiled-coil domain-containing protein 60 [Lissotriton helveticus]